METEQILETGLDGNLRLMLSHAKELRLLISL